MPSRQGKPRSPQVKRNSQLALLVTAIKLQMGIATKAVKVLVDGNPVIENGKPKVTFEKLPKGPGCPFLIRNWNAALKVKCAQVGKSFATFQVTLKNLPGKLNTLRSWYLERKAKVPATLNPYVPASVVDGKVVPATGWQRDFFGNIARSLVTMEQVIEGETVRIVQPEYADIVEQPTFYGDEGYELEGLPMVTGRTSDDTIITGDEYVEFDFDGEDFEEEPAE